MAGFAILAAVAVRNHRRLRHEAALCLTAIGTVLLVDPPWVLRIGETLRCLMFVVGLVPHVPLRRRVCDSREVMSQVHTSQVNAGGRYTAPAEHP